MAKELNVRGLMNVQFAVKDEQRLCARSQPARLAHRAVRQQGDRRTAREARRKNHGRQNAQANSASRRKSSRRITRVKEAVFPFIQLPRHRHRARAGNEIDRRSHGHRRRSRPRLRQGADGRAAAAADRAATCSSASKTPTNRTSPRSPPNIAELGFKLFATGGTATALDSQGSASEQASSSSPKAARTCST